jgi:hypothetical protein
MSIINIYLYGLNGSKVDVKLKGHRNNTLAVIAKHQNLFKIIIILMTTVSIMR